MDSPLQIIHGALDALVALVEHVGVNHGGFHVLVAEQFLHGPDIVTALQSRRVCTVNDYP